MSVFTADRAEIERFVNVLFKHADEGAYVSLRTFEHRRGAPPVEIKAFQLIGEGLGPIVARATGQANRAARHELPTVFAPSIATLRSAKGAAEADVANGLAIAIECDEHPRRAVEALRAILGGATMVVRSGGEWTNAATGAVEPKLHAYFLLTAPTRAEADHARLKRANRLAAALAGSDPSAVPLVHCLRWPGSIHRKGTPCRAVIDELHEEFEVDLGDALARLEDAARLTLAHADGEAAKRLRAALDIREAASSDTPPPDPDAHDADFDALAATIANEDEHWAEWVSVGLAFYAAGDGSPEAFNAWNDWSGKSEKHHDITNVEQWDRFAKSPPSRTGTGALVARAKRAQPDFRLPSYGPRREYDGWAEGEPRARPREKQARAKGNGQDKAEAVILDPTDPYRSAAVFLERHCSHRDGRTLQRHRGSFYAYTGTHYREMEAEELRRVLYLFLDGAQVWRTAGKKTKGDEPTFELAPFKPNRSHVHDLVDTVQARAGIDDQLAMPCWLGKADPQGAVIPLANGLLEIATRRLHPHSPRYFQSYSLSFDYAPQAPPPAEWLRFLDSLWPDDPEARDTLQEVMGLLLTDDTSHHKLFMLVGPPRSGKGTIARVMQRMHGKENVAGPTLSSLAMNFGLQELIGKPVAVISDARLSGRSDAAVIAERLLSISGEDCLTIDRKHRDPWTGTLPTRFLILTNELPRIADSSGALASRFVILMLTKSFLGKEDHQLMTKLTPELSGIFNWALAGKARLEQRGYFVMPKSSQEAVEEIIALSSPFRAFIRDCCVIAPAAEVKVSVLYAQWRAWCSIQGSNRPGTVQAFGTALRAAAAHLKVVQHRDPPDDKLDRYYLGVRLRKEADQCL